MFYFKPDKILQKFVSACFLDNKTQQELLCSPRNSPGHVMCQDLVPVSFFSPEYTLF